MRTPEERDLYAGFDAQWDGAKGHDQPGPPAEEPETVAHDIRWLIETTRAS